MRLKPPANAARVDEPVVGRLMQPVSVQRIAIPQAILYDKDDSL